MKWIINLLFFAFVAIAQGVIAQVQNMGPDPKTDTAHSLSTADKIAVMEAIVDEIYANNIQGFMADVGTETPDSGYQVNAYFKPAVNSNKTGWVIYKLMPYGEVLRMFTLCRDGSAVLYGKLRDRFPPTQPSYLTVYMDDDELCQAKSEWSKEHFAVELIPSAERIADAVARDRKRNSPTALFGTWKVKQILPTTNIAGLSQEQADSLIGTCVAYSDSSATSAGVLLRPPGYKTSVWSVTEFFQHRFSHLEELGISDTIVTVVELEGGDDLPVAFFGGTVFMKKKTIVVDYEGIFFELARVKADSIK